MNNGIMIKEGKVTLSPDVKNTLMQANRRLTNMEKRTSDKNVRNTLEIARNDLSILSKGNKYTISSDMTQRQANAVLRSAETLISSPYSTSKGTQALYRKQRKTLGKELGLNAKQTADLVSLFDETNDIKTSNAWQKIKDEPLYTGLSKSIMSSIGESVQNIGAKKFGYMMRLYTEAGLQDDYNSFVDYLNDKEIQSFFANNNLNTISDFVDNKLWE